MHLRFGILWVLFFGQVYAHSNCASLLRGEPNTRESHASPMMGYALLGSGIIANSAISAGILTAISPELQFMPLFAGSFLGQMSFVSVSLLAPFLEPVASHLRRRTFAVMKGEQRGTEKEVSLEDQADRIHATYTLREQHATDRILTFRNAIRLNMLSARQALRDRDEESFIAEIADAALLGYQHFRDISPRSRTILHSVRAILGPVPSALVETAPERVLQWIETHDGRIPEQAQDYYHLLLSTWFSPGRLESGR